MPKILAISATVESSDGQIYRVEVDEALGLPEERGDWKIRILKFPFKAHEIPETRFVTGGSRKDALNTGILLIP